MQHRWFVSIMTPLLFSYAGCSHVHESGSRTRLESSVASREEAAEARHSSSRTSSASASHSDGVDSDGVDSNEEAPRERSTRKATAQSRRSAKPGADRDAKSGAAPEPEETSGADAFAGVDTVAPVDDPNDRVVQDVVVKGIEGTMTEYDVRSILESRDGDFDLCHDQFRGGSGRIEFRIHILASGDVGDVKVHKSKVHGSELVDCYKEVVSTSHFTPPHGGYADVKWTTKVGRSRKKADAIFQRPVRWDAPSSAGGTTQREESGETRRERRHHRHRKGA